MNVEGLRLLPGLEDNLPVAADVATPAKSPAVKGPTLRKRAKKEEVPASLPRQTPVTRRKMTVVSPVPLEEEACTQAVATLVGSPSAVTPGSGLESPAVVADTSVATRADPGTAVTGHE